VRTPARALPIVELEQAPNHSLEVEVQAEVQLGHRQASVAIDGQQPDQIGRGPAEGNRLHLGSEDALDLAQPVGQHLVDVGERLASDPFARTRQVFGRGRLISTLAAESDEAVAGHPQPLDLRVQGRHA